MSTDRELLVDAARAAGIVLGAWWDDPRMCCFRVVEGWPRITFNSLDNDGDALRLAVKLGMRVEFWPAHPNGCGGKVEIDGNAVLIDGETGDIMAATCRAITRAAAAIGVTTAQQDPLPDAFGASDAI